MDNVDYGWVERAERPYDPPLTDDGIKEALEAGQRFKDEVSLEILMEDTVDCVCKKICTRFCADCTHTHTHTHAPTHRIFHV